MGKPKLSKKVPLLGEIATKIKTPYYVHHQWDGGEFQKSCRFGKYHMDLFLLFRILKLLLFLSALNESLFGFLQ